MSNIHVSLHSKNKYIMKEMKLKKITSGIILGLLSTLIYIYTTYEAYKFFYAYSYLRNVWLLLGVIGMTLCWLWVIWFLFYAFDYFLWDSNKGKKITVEIPKNVQDEAVIIKEEIWKKKEIKVATEESVQRKKDKKIQTRYKEILIEYKEILPTREYKKFQEDTKYDILLYDALLISRDEEGILLSKIEKEKWEFYASTIKKILAL